MMVADFLDPLVSKLEHFGLAALDHLRPGVQTVRGKPPHRVDEARARDDIFEAPCARAVAAG